MNTRFQSWFAQGKAVEALCGLGDYFSPDVTYREEHDFVLAVGELLEWARTGHREAATRAFEAALITLLDAERFENALRLLRSYLVLQNETPTPLPLDESGLASRFGRAARDAAEQLSRDQSLRDLLLSVTRDFPSLKAAIGIT